MPDRRNRGSVHQSHPVPTRNTSKPAQKRVTFLSRPSNKPRHNNNSNNHNNSRPWTVYQIRWAQWVWVVKDLPLLHQPHDRIRRRTDMHTTTSKHLLLPSLWPLDQVVCQEPRRHNSTTLKVLQCLEQPHRTCPSRSRLPCRSSLPHLPLSRLPTLRLLWSTLLVKAINSCQLLLPLSQAASTRTRSPVCRGHATFLLVTTRSASTLPWSNTSLRPLPFLLSLLIRATVLQSSLVSP
jgi:hypothetical protein